MIGSESLRSVPLLVLPAAGGALVAAAAGSGSPSPAAAVAAAALVAAFLVWTWAVLPVSILLGAAGAEALGLTSVGAIVALHTAMLGCGMLALAVKGSFGFVPRRRRTAADGPMAVLAAFAALGFLYGVARGNGPYSAVVAVYQVGIIPLYYWIATLTLGEQLARVRAGTLFVVGACALAAIGLATPGRHGGFLSALALLPLLSAIARQSRPDLRFVLICGAALLSVDVALAAYRSVWLAVAVALGVVALRGSRSERRAIVAALGLAFVVGLASYSLIPAISSRVAAVEEQLAASPGYRLSEATVGLDVFASSPLMGQGLGQSTPGVYLPGFQVAEVGPVYHVFYVTVLANGGALLLVAVVAAMLPALALLLLPRAGPSLPWTALLLGFLAAAAFSAPTDGHWELGLLPALALMVAGPTGPRAGRRTCAVAGGQHATEPEPTIPAMGPRRPGDLGDARPSAAPSRTDAAERRTDVAAVVVTYNSRDEIGACLDALAESVDRTIVVDNASGDGTAAFVSEHHPAVELIANADNVGFARAVNQAAARTDHATVMLVNPDCVLAPGTARALHEHLRSHPDVGIAAPQLLDSGGRPVVSVHRFETLVTVVASRFGGSLLRSVVRSGLFAGADRRRTTEVDWASGACLAVRADLLDRLGGLDEGYFMFYEDEELCLQARQVGLSVAYLPGVSAQHVGGASSNDPATVWPHLYTSMLRFFSLHRPTTVPVLRAVLVLRAGIGMALAVARGRRRPAIAWWRIARVALGPVPSRTEERS